MKKFFLSLMTVLAAGGPLAGLPPEKPVEAPGPLAPLKGVMSSPKDQGAPVVLIVPGSGPTDRDGNNPLGVNASTYKLLAQELAARGVATVRIDKRGMFESAKSVLDPNAVTIEDYARDVGSWVGAIRRGTGAPCVWVLGHSEGGLVALVAGQHDPHICGLVLAAAPGRPLGQVLRGQLKANPANAPVLGQAFAAIDELEAGRRVDPGALHPALRPLFNPQVQGFLASAFALDPALLAAACKKPILVLQGGRDLQIGTEDARRLSQAASSSKLVLLPDANHVLKQVGTDDLSANLATYGNPDLPLSPGIADAIANFISSAAVRQ
jgi:pimeloyl-ACP methyl ester carboxylesterase